MAIGEYSGMVGGGRGSMSYGGMVNGDCSGMVVWVIVILVA